MHSKKVSSVTVLRYVVLALIFVLLVGPIIWQVSLAFKGKGDNIYAVPPYFIPKDFTWSNFAKVFQQVPVLHYAWNSLIVTAITVIGNVIISTTCGYALGKLKFRGKTAVLILIFGAMLIPGEAVLVSQFLEIRAMHLNNTLMGVALPGLCQAMNILIMMTAFAGIPNELEEAAKVDGANVWQRFFRICMPQVMGSITVTVIFSFVGAWTNFLWPMIVLSDDAKYTLTIGLNKLKGAFLTDPRLIAAGAVIALIPIVIFFLIFQRYFFKGVEAGGLKG